MKLAFSHIRRLNDKHPRLLEALCLAILLIILMAGLWPFNFQARNKVAWLPDQDGVLFYGQGIIISSAELNKEQQSIFPEKSITLEIRLRPLQVTGNLPHILALYDGSSPDIFFIGQWRSHLIIRSRTDNPAKRKKGKDYGEIGLNNALQKNQDCLLTITSRAGGTAVYINGKLMQFYPGYNIIAGVTERPVRLVLGNSPTGESHWNGMLTGLAIYNRTLSADQVFESYNTWTSNSLSTISADNGCLGRYLFNERKGTTVRNEYNTNDTLNIPEKFKPLKRKFLSPLWSEFRWNLSFVQDIITNILGFLPFGFFFSALLLKHTRLSRLPAYLVIVIFGTGLSFAIEMTQAYLPSRDSSLTDLVMNSTGTIFGIVIFYILHYTIVWGIEPKKTELKR